ncbi:LOW QUALITY PROTEIN: uncharacterized protein LOC110176347 [Drosophila serrata]|uniref:LOW QUALITY PROTEIN: uncharacterized protein LOC110176347 n=1 Tax=Drosophila serrata TaxID=7274 RepID=UPI000A1D2FA4|nr:LOW QUALITY PROTEIN: uncharacterized protein LOC110176347 [Drosophila serrata]
MSMCSTSKDVDLMRCMHCQKVIRMSRCDPDCLLRHVEMEHPSKCTLNSSRKCKGGAEQSCDTNDNRVASLVAKPARRSRMHMLAAEHGISEERLSEISRKTGLSEEQMAEKADAYMKKKGYAPSSLVSGGGEKAYTTTFSCQVKDPCPCKCSEKEQAKRKQCYRLSIRRWMPADGCIFCPCCGCQRRPMIKAASEIATSKCCAAWIVVCWPFCLLPCLDSSDNREYLYCSNCKAFLGIYDREKRCIRPSREFVTCCSSATPPPTAK